MALGISTYFYLGGNEMKIKGGFASTLFAIGMLQASLAFSYNASGYGASGYGTSGYGASGYGGGLDHGYVGEWSGWSTDNFLSYEWPYQQSNDERAEFSAFEPTPMGTGASRSATPYSGMYEPGRGMEQSGSGFWRQGSDSPFIKYSTKTAPADRRCSPQDWRKPQNHVFHSGRALKRVQNEIWLRSDRSSV